MFFSCLELQLQPWLVSHDCCDDPPPPPIAFLASVHSSQKGLALLLPAKVCYASHIAKEEKLPLQLFFQGHPSFASKHRSVISRRSYPTRYFPNSLDRYVHSVSPGSLVFAEYAREVLDLKEECEHLGTGAGGKCTTEVILVVMSVERRTAAYEVMTYISGQVSTCSFLLPEFRVIPCICL